MSRSRPTQATIDERKAVWKTLDAADSVANHLLGKEHDAYLLQAIREEHPAISETQAKVMLTVWKADFR